MLNKYGICIANKDSIVLNSIKTNEIESKNIYSINVVFYDNKLNDVTSQVCIYWYDDSRNYLTQASSLSQVKNGTKLIYEIELILTYYILRINYY